MILNKYDEIFLNKSPDIRIIKILLSKIALFFHYIRIEATMQNHESLKGLDFIFIRLRKIMSAKKKRLFKSVGVCVFFLPSDGTVCILEA